MVEQMAGWRMVALGLAAGIFLGYERPHVESTPATLSGALSSVHVDGVEVKSKNIW
jgi:hypothetical protein